MESHPAEVGSLHTTHWGCQDDKVDRPEVTVLQTEPLDFPGVEDGEEDGPLLLVRHHRARDVQGGELSQAGAQNVGMNSGQGNTEQPQLSDVGSWIINNLLTLSLENWEGNSIKLQKIPSCFLELFIKALISKADCPSICLRFWLSDWLTLIENVSQQGGQLFVGDLSLHQLDLLQTGEDLSEDLLRDAGNIHKFVHLQIFQT